MKIIRNGDLENIRQIKFFHCLRCGCIFEAEAGEYHVEEGLREDHYTMDCPVCGNRCFGRDGRNKFLG